MKIKIIYLESSFYKVMMLFLLFGLVACNREPKISIIKGTVDNCEGCQVEFSYDDPGQLTEIKLKGTKVQQGKFSFVINTDSLPRAGVYLVRMMLHEDNEFRNNKFTAVQSQIYLPADTVKLTMDLGGRPGGKVYPYPKTSSNLNFVNITSTSSVQQELNFYLQMRDSMDVKFENYRNLRTAFFSQAIQSGDKQEIDKWADTLNNFFATGSLYRPKAADVFIQKYPTSQLVPYVMLDNRKEMSAIPRFRKYYQALSPEQQNSYYGKVLNNRLASWKAKNTKFTKYIIGTEITYLSGKTPRGEKLDADKIFKKDKLTLVDFWASWCDSCRLRTPNYRQLYQTYQNKGFEIISVSLDVNGGTWLKAIQQDQMPWQHVSDMKENSGDIMQFRLKSLPANLLMNHESRIVAVDVTPEKLEAELKKKL